MPLVAAAGGLLSRPNPDVQVSMGFGLFPPLGWQGFGLLVCLSCSAAREGGRAVPISRGMGGEALLFWW